MIQKYIDENKDYIYKTIEELCNIPAPSHHEEIRAEYCKKWLEDNGAKGVYIDEALNVIYPMNCEGSNEISVFAAHTDTVFPDTEPMPFVDDGEKLHSPGVGDDTANVVAILFTAKYFIENGIVPKNGIMIVCNSCEEGLGNLKGTRQLFKDFEGRISRFISYDGNIERIADRSVGSHRYEVEVLTEGGHSFSAFGKENAIAELAKIVTEIHNLEVPQIEGEKTTYNVGGISGGTSVNTIAQNAKMLCEYRSTSREALAIMQKSFEDIFEAARNENVTVKVTKIGDRPCSNIDDKAIDKLKEIIVPIVEKIIKKPVRFNPSSTDCNIPLSLGIPAVCLGACIGAGAHTREEWIDKASILKGVEYAIKVISAFAEV